jgi:16S rRNA (adenine1518-N6/adenine1519-N6)-dimethyltransferase
MGQRLGQHFLTDENVLKSIVSLSEIKSTDSVIEIGPGHGELTKYLAEKKPKNLILIEADRELTTDLKKNFPEAEVVDGDVLEILKETITSFKGDYILVGNIPYYITGYLFRIIGDLDKKPKVIVFTVQKEVALRICSQSPRMNLLAASVQFWAKPTLEMVIKRSLFNPPPKVDSAVIKLSVLSAKPENENKKYYELIKKVFAQPRKTILNNLSNGFDMTKDDVSKKLLRAMINPGDRPQNLTINKISILAAEFYAKK